MNEKEIVVLNWFKKGDNDLRAAEVIVCLEDPLPDIVCFHAQQCAEKYLKGFLTFHDVEIRKTHDLVEILNECGNIDPAFIELEEECRALTIYAVDPRYPDVKYEYSTAEAEKAVAFAARLKEFVRSKVKLID